MSLFGFRGKLLSRFVADLLLDEITIFRFRQTNAWIPVRMLHVPGKFFRRSTFHDQLGHDVAELVFESTNPTVGQNDIRVQDFTGLWIDAAWSDRGANVVVQPTNEVVANIFGIFFHVLAGLTILLADFDRIGDADFSERFIPVQDAFANETAIANWSRVLDVENDWLFRRAQAKLWIALLEVPAIDITNVRLVIFVLTVVTELGHEVTDTLIRFTWLVVFGPTNFAD